MSNMKARHVWCAQKVAFHFAQHDIDAASATKVVESNFGTFDNLFEENNETSKVFVYADEGSLQISLDAGNGDLLKTGACYFVRLRKDRPAIAEQANCPNLVFGQLSDSPLSSLETLLSEVYKPLLDCDTKQWGKANSTQSAEFLGEVDKFATDLQDAVKHLQGGIELRKPEADFIAMYDSNDNSSDADMLAHFDGLLDEWCREIEKLLAEKETTSGAGGLMDELEHWRRRMQHLTGITDQLKSKECRTVFACLTAQTKNTQDPNRSKIFNLLRRYKQIDINLTEAANEAKDNQKYLFTLERFVEPLYKGTPQSVVDIIPALMNSIKMIHTIARYYNTSERMTNLFVKITNQMIENCKVTILADCQRGADLWNQDPQALLENLEACLKLNEAYQQTYRETKAKLLKAPTGKQFDFDEKTIFGKFEHFCRRVTKLIDMFGTVHQFSALSNNNLEGMDHLIVKFEKIVKDFQRKRHDLLDYQKNTFDRDYVEFNVNISDLESMLQDFINESFAEITSIENSLALLQKFKKILQRETLRADLDSKLNVIFQNYAQELHEVQELYEKHKHSPPFTRNMPPVAGNITWSRHLLKRIEEPMKKFEANQSVLGTQDAKKIIAIYNKVARMLVAFEYLWYQAWVQSTEQSKAGLQATLIIRHPQDNKLYVNFDQQIMQLIREAKCLDRMSIEIPADAKIVLLQEAKFKEYFSELKYSLVEYDRVISAVIPVTAMLLRPQFNDMEFILRPGMINLTWTSMNVDNYKHNVAVALARLESLIMTTNDILENRVEKNLKTISKTTLVDLAPDVTFTLEEFTVIQQKTILSHVANLQGKNVEIENAVEDLVKLIIDYPLDKNIEPASKDDIKKLKKHYNTFMYQALLHCTKNSLNVIKTRIGKRLGFGGVIWVDAPFFEVKLQLNVPDVRLKPSLNDIQGTINEAAKAVIGCTKTLWDWDQNDIPESKRMNFYDRVTQDIEIVRVCLLLTGSIQGCRNSVDEYLAQFKRFEWMWIEQKGDAYQKFMDEEPELDDYEHKLQHFVQVETDVEHIQTQHSIGTLSLNTASIKNQLATECNSWKILFANNLRKQAKEKMELIFEYIRVTSGKVNREAVDLESLNFVMKTLMEVRQKESDVDMDINPILYMYSMLEHHLPEGFIEKDEMDQRSVLRNNWRKLVHSCEKKTQGLSVQQGQFKKQLVTNVRDLTVDVKNFRKDYLKNGPNVEGIKPMVAVERLNRYNEELKIRTRKQELYSMGEKLFALPQTDFPELGVTKKELELQSRLFGLYVDVIETIDEWKLVEWSNVLEIVEDMQSKVDGFALRCKKMPARLREWDAYKELKQTIEDFQLVLPLFAELTKDSIMDRHWDEVKSILGVEFEQDSSEFKLNTLLDANIAHFNDDIEEVTEGADKQLKIEQQMKEIAEMWDNQDFAFMEWKDRKINILKATGPIVEELEDAEMNLQTMLTMRHVTPFREEAQEQLTSLSDTSENLERWMKVQMLWCSLESVFTGGDIAKQMPVEAKKFQKIDKDWQKIMGKAFETKNVVECCANELLKNSLPNMYAELEKCQKSLEGYLEQKRNKFPRFYFVSNPSLLLILSQGSDPTSMNSHYEKVFDSIFQVVHDTKDKTVIHTILCGGGAGAEVVPFANLVKAVGNIEDWLGLLLHEQQVTMKDICRNCAADIIVASHDVKSLRGFVDNYIAQFALLGIQFLWSTDVQGALDVCKTKKTAVKESNQRQLAVLMELSSWCLQDLGAKPNRKKIETLVTIHVHQRDVAAEMANLVRQKKISDGNDFEWLAQARFAWHAERGDECNSEGACIISVTDVDFTYQYEYLGSKERLVVTPLTDRCYISLSQALGMYFGGAPAGPAGTGKTETVKDMGRTLGIWVVVTNCTDQQSYLDCAKIFKGLCQAGLWGCFDEFNRIQLPVLSVVAQYVLCILNAKKGAVEYFQFPGDPTDILILPVCGFFITMNPGYAGRQELPENLKALFRGVVMMVPDFQIIIKVKLCSVGYSEFNMLSMKFHILYLTNKEQLSAQRHYDWGLRNILSVLRTGGQTKRNNLEDSESKLLYQTLRDMNLSKLVAQDVPLFLSLLADLFPSVAFPPKGVYPEVQQAMSERMQFHGLTEHEDWVLKCIQLYETQLVRHGIMQVGPSCGGKSRVFQCLSEALSKTIGQNHKIARMNPKAIRAQEMYGEVDGMSGEWTTGCFAAIWAKCNSRDQKNIMWIVMDGPVDAIWIEDLNTVLDDNRILTLANGDRIPMSETCKIMFEVETLVNASPATVSRAGIVYVSETDLDWSPVLAAWLRTRPDAESEILTALFTQYCGCSTPIDVGHAMSFIIRECNAVMVGARVGVIQGFCNLLQLLIDNEIKVPSSSDGDFAAVVERIFLYAFVWTIGGLLEPEGRNKLDAYIREICTSDNVPEPGEHETLYEYYVDPETTEWQLWRPPVWNYPNTKHLDFSNLLVPTMDSTRAQFIIATLQKANHNVLLLGGSGTAKTSTAYMYLDGLDENVMLTKIMNFSSATSPFMFQNTVETQLDKRGGKKFGPAQGKKMTFFLDDISMPLVNNWGDQPTLEAVRLVMEQGYFTFLDKDKRGDFKICEDLQWVGAMTHPGAGRNDVPNRLKAKFFIFNLVLPSITSINDMYGQMLDGRFTKKDFNEEALNVVNELTKVTIQLWNKMKNKMLPTPAKFHYVFNMRELSRVFQGVLLTPKETIKNGGGIIATEGKKSTDGKQDFKLPKTTEAETVLGIWKHECERVFCDKLASNEDKDWYLNFIDTLVEKDFGEDLAEATKSGVNMISFYREDVYDIEGVFECFAPKVYEVGGTLEMIRDRVNMFMEKHNEEFPQKAMHLVLFQDALKHMLRISRLVEMPRGSALLVGVGGSGKQSLTRLAGYISNAFVFQVTLTKQYNTVALMDDLRILYKSAGHARKPTVFLFTESEIKDEIFLELINSVLMTGEVAGLIAKDEMMAMCADLRNPFLAERPGVEENALNMKQFFMDTVRDNLHLVLCMSPLNPKFPERARKFPGLVSAPTIDWFLPWPEEALVTVSYGLISDFHIECTKEVKQNVMTHMGNVHRMVCDVCDEYSTSMSRKVYQTPKSYLSFLAAYKVLYTEKLATIQDQASRVNLGLDKLVKGAADVEDMKIVLAEEQIKLEKATKDTNVVLANLQVSSAEAQKEGEKVSKIAESCKADATRIGGEKAQCAKDLAKAQPYVDQAETAIDSIKPAHINEIKKLPKPSDIIKLVFDGVLILFKRAMNPVKPEELTIAKQQVPFIESSFIPHSQVMMGDTGFLTSIQDFGKYEKDLINEETIEFMLPYIDLENFTPQVAKNASAAAEGLCTWVRAMKFYHEASKIVKPKLEALGIAEGQLQAANKALAAAETRLKACTDKLAELQAVFEAQMGEKKRIEDGANALARKMQQASDLIGGLAGERVRWTEDSNNFGHVIDRLVGDCAIACGFVSYCGPFNQDFRRYLVQDKFYNDCKARNVPATKDIDIIPFLVDIGTIGDWNQEKLPTDPLSIQNGILVTQSSRFALLCDPQAQAITWIKTREKDRMPPYGTTNISHPKLKDQLEYAMGEGLALIVTGVEEEIDPMLDPVLEKEIIVKGKRMSINIGDKNMDYNPKFSMYFITRLPNPHFSPELQAKTTLVDFTVTQKGLEEQLLGRVISKEQHALEEQLAQVLEDVNSNTKALLQLDAELLNRLTSNTGSLLEDDELIGVLANTKAKAEEVKEKLTAADETKKNINEKREQFRPVATRGAVLYFAIVEMSLVNCMYQVSLEQFSVLFMKSMDEAEKAALASKRVENIIETMTYITYRYINRGLYEEDKLLFLLLLTLKVLVTAGHLSSGDVALFLRAGAALDINTVRRKPFNWLSNESWLNVIQLSMSNKFFSQLPNEMSGNEGMWRRWYEDNEPESMAIPDYEQRLNDQQEIGAFLRFLVVRMLRVDRSILACNSFIQNTREIGPRYVEPVTDTIGSVYDSMVKDIPVIFLLSPGADPTDAIENLARKRKMPIPANVSLGQGQEPVALKAMNAAAVNGGSWVVLQNCELGIPLMIQMEEYLGGLQKDTNFRLFLSCLPSKEFPLVLLQMSTKVTNEPPAGLKAGLLRSYTVQVDQDRLERVETLEWRQLLYVLCFLHSIVQERRKFGPLGWCVPYEFNTGDIEACMKFLEKHLYNGPISWPTLQYMVHAVQYGGRITDSCDRRMFYNYASSWVRKSVLEEDFTYNPKEPIQRTPGDFVYSVQSSDQLDDYHKYCNQFPEIDSPEIFGLHPNADLTFRVKQANMLLSQMNETQPKGGGGGGDEKSPTEIVYEKATELLERVPEDYIEDDYKAKIQKLGGLSVPLNIFLYQEIQRLQSVVHKVRTFLISTQQAIRGEVVMTDELQDGVVKMFEAKPPVTWVYTVTGDEFSWILPTLGLWFSSFLARDAQNRTWMDSSRPMSFWLTGFFNPQGILTAMKQEVTRRHKSESWALDDMVYHTDVTTMNDIVNVKALPAEGLYIHGLQLDGGAWNKPDKMLQEQEPKKLFVPLPVVHVSSSTKTIQTKVNREMFGSWGAYESPVYKYFARTDRFFIFFINLRCTNDKNPVFWGLRGVALLCNTV